LNITPQEFFDTSSADPRGTNDLLTELKKLTPAQTEHILQLVKDLTEK